MKCGLIFRFRLSGRLRTIPSTIGVCVTALAAGRASVRYDVPRPPIYAIDHPEETYLCEVLLRSSRRAQCSQCALPKRIQQERIVPGSGNVTGVAEAKSACLHRLDCSSRRPRNASQTPPDAEYD